MKQRIYALFLALTLVLAAVPMTAIAAEEEAKPETSTTTTKKKDHTHNYFFTISRTEHFKQCECGLRKDVVHHVDPKDAKDGKCTCGYKFSDNTDLSLIWMDGVRLTSKAKKGVTEYEGKTVTYKDITETRFNVRTFDAMATLELPEDTTIKKGTNKFEFKVTAEDGKTTQTYTVTVVKE